MIANFKKLLIATSGLFLIILVLFIIVDTKESDYIFKLSQGDFKQNDTKFFHKDSFYLASYSSGVIMFLMVVICEKLFKRKNKPMVYMFFALLIFLFSHPLPLIIVEFLNPYTYEKTRVLRIVIWFLTAVAHICMCVIVAKAKKIDSFYVYEQMKYISEKQKIEQEKQRELEMTKRLEELKDFLANKRRKTKELLEHSGKNFFVKYYEILKIHPEITTIIQNINNKNTSMVLGDRENILFGKGYITDILCGCKFRISAKSFYQINPVQTEKLYNIAIDYAGLTGEETVIDAYCGIGTIGIVASKNAKNVIGVELNEDAVHDAIINAKENEINNVNFYNDDAGEFMIKFVNSGQKIDVVFMDPPRAGSDKNFLSKMVTLSPEKVVYISCNPQTQARDLLYLSKNGYKVKKIQPVDMFPHTSHVETVCLLSRKDK